MKTQRVRLLLLGVLLALFRPVPIAGGESTAPTQALQNSEPRTAQQAGAILIDHTCTDLNQIPAYWVEQAKQLAFHYAHTSHGSQIISGLETLNGVQPQYAFDRFTASSNPPTSLDCEAGALCLYDGNPPETYITPEDYWQSQGGLDRTQAVAETGLFDYSMWSWCGQQSSNSEATVQQYLDTMHNLESTFPDMRFILMTGHTDGGSTTLAQNNNMVRQYAANHGKVLFDFADIETYDPLGGGPYDNNSEGNCNWCVDFCTAHPEYCTHLPGYCAHTDDHPQDHLFCKLKGNAFWWMMARLAGWSGPNEAGPTKTASTRSALHGETITYTLVIRDLGTPLSATVALTDQVPSGLTYVPGSLSATAGDIDASTAPTLYWHGELTPSPVVTISYAVTVYEVTSRVITNTARIGASGMEVIERSAGVLVNGYRIALPLMLKDGDS